MVQFSICELFVGQHPAGGRVQCNTLPEGERGMLNLYKPGSKKKKKHKSQLSYLPTKLYLTPFSYLIHRKVVRIYIIFEIKMQVQVKIPGTLPPRSSLLFSFPSSTRLKITIWKKMIIHGQCNEIMCILGLWFNLLTL